MASMTQSPVSFSGNLASKLPASDFLRSSNNGVCGVPLKVLGKAQLGVVRRDFSVTAKLGKMKKREHPWPIDPDLNPTDLKGGFLRHLSPFKPLTEKPKPVILDFERPLVDLQKKIEDVKRMANETGLDFAEQIKLLEENYEEARRRLYTHLTPIQRVNISRHPHRPTMLDHIYNITESFVELHGDRAGYDDPAIVTGIGSINGKGYMFMGHQKGRNTKENIKRNFGMPTPHGYRKALRMMHYADHHGFPIVTFVDTPGAYADLKSEELGQGEAIAQNLRTMFGLKVPIISIVMGEGGSGGALAIACANKLLMLENAVFYVASPEACAAILWKDAKQAPAAAKLLKITATELSKLKVCDGIIREPLGGAHTDPEWTSMQIKNAILKGMKELSKMDTKTLLKHRAEKFRKIGRYNDRIKRAPVDPVKKRNMKKKDIPIEENPMAELNRMAENLKNEIDSEFEKASKVLGIDDKILKVRDEIKKRRNSVDEKAMKEKFEKINKEFKKNLHTAPNFPSIVSKLQKLNELSKTTSNPPPQKNSSNKKNEVKLKMDKISEELIKRPDLKHKIETLKAEMEKSDVDSNPELKEKVLQLRKEINSEFKNCLKSAGLEVVPLKRNALEKIGSYGEEVKTLIGNVAKSSGFREKIDVLKEMVAKAGNMPNEKTKGKIQALMEEIKREMSEAIVSSPELKEKHEKLEKEILGDGKAPAGSNDGSVGEDDSKVTLEVETNHSFV
ncbi:Acetyl-coenzyme A carboxylase carboxyl transferase subunit alpha- chloroplastic [Striga hermonthica]|uniref:acetyl-CoA carboxytransferase n=1 Tax=Striga hermonthica TaxID=68872 RepID=A0A9N7NP99_STRHE|nr:Acetyl-coenzyme A carboxylase carboxyl transferase subunit alpha- chloroplastic [Striga hermonthica]